MQCLHLKAFNVLFIIKGYKTKRGSSRDRNAGNSFGFVLASKKRISYCDVFVRKHDFYIVLLVLARVRLIKILISLLIVFNNYFNTLIHMWHWKTFFLLWRVLCFKIRYKNSRRGCNLFASKPHPYHKCSELRCWSEILWKCSCGHILQMCSSSQVQQAWRSKLTHQATFAETKTCAVLLWFCNRIWFNEHYQMQYNGIFVVTLCTRRFGKVLMC